VSAFLPCALLAQLAPEPDGPFTFLLLGLALCVAVTLFAFWLWMVIDCVQIPPESSDYSSRPMWLLLIFFIGWIGALLYFFTVRRRRLARRRSRHARSRRHSPGLPATPAAPPR
jgi:hypothetical protein